MLFDWIAKRCRKPEPTHAKPAVKTSAEWCAYFQAHAEALEPIAWDEVKVEPEELAEIVDSLRAWQLGETSEGTHLRAAARKYADATGDGDFVHAIDLFIAEEQRHGETLGCWF